MRKKIKNLFMFLLSTVFLITGCASSEKSTSGLTTPYNDILSSLAENQYYAYAELEGLKYPVLLVTDGIFELDQETQASFLCDVYYIKSDEPVLLDTSNLKEPPIRSLMIKKAFIQPVIIIPQNTMSMKPHAS